MLGLDYSSSDDSGDENSENVVVKTCVEKEDCSYEHSHSKSFVEVDESKSSAELSFCDSTPRDMVSNTSDTDIIKEDTLSTISYSTESVNPHTIARCKQYLSLPNFDLTESIRSKKDFGNPQILEVVVEHFKIHETGSNYPKDLFDPEGYRECDYEDGIRRFNLSGAVPAPTPAPVTCSVPLHSRTQSANASTSIPLGASATATATATASATTTATADSGRIITSSVTGKKRRSKFSDAAA